MLGFIFNKVNKLLAESRAESEEKYKTLLAKSEEKCKELLEESRAESDRKYKTLLEAWELEKKLKEDALWELKKKEMWHQVMVELVTKNEEASWMESVKREMWNKVIGALVTKSKEASLVESVKKLVEASLAESVKKMEASLAESVKKMEASSAESVEKLVEDSLEESVGKLVEASLEESVEKLVEESLEKSDRKWGKELDELKGSITRRFAEVNNNMCSVQDAAGSTAEAVETCLKTERSARKIARSLATSTKRILFQSGGENRRKIVTELVEVYKYPYNEDDDLWIDATTTSGIEIIDLDANWLEKKKENNTTYYVHTKDKIVVKGKKNAVRYIDISNGHCDFSQVSGWTPVDLEKEPDLIEGWMTKKFGKVDNFYNPEATTVEAGKGLRFNPASAKAFVNAKPSAN